MNKENLSEKKWYSQIFDDVFRTMCERMPMLLIPLINEAFGTSYSKKDELVQLRNERHFDGERLVTDGLVKLGEKLYHLECQSTDDSVVLLRMFEYDASIALENGCELPSGYEVRFPNSCVIYLRGKDVENRKQFLRVVFPDEQSFTYKLKVLEVEAYELDEIFQKDLLMFLPYYILRYEKNLPTKKDRKEFKNLIEKFSSIVDTLNETLFDDRSDYYSRLLELIFRICSYVTRGNRSLKKGLGDIMGGRVLRLKCDKIIEESEARGEAKGINIGTDEKGITVYINCINRGMSREAAQGIAEISDKLVEEAEARIKKAKKKK